MMIPYNKIKRALRIESIEFQLQKYRELEKSYNEVDSKINDLADTFRIEKSLHDRRVKDESNKVILDRINSRFNNFLESHKEEIRKAKSEYTKLKKQKEALESDESIKKALEDVRKSEAYERIKKAYKDGNITPESFNNILKSVTKSDVTKYADFILYNEKGQILLLKRSQWEDDNKGAWVVPGGHVDPGEDFETAAKRELVEESGYTVTDCENVGQYKDDKAHIEYFTGSINSNETEAVLDVFEARDLKWIHLDEIYDYNMVFNMKENLLKILGMPEKNKTIISKKQHTNILGKYGEEVLKTIEDALKNGKKRDYTEKLSKLKKRRDPEGIEDWEVKKAELDSLYDDLNSELEKAETKKQFLIEKGFFSEADLISQEIEKAKKDISKLNKIKKLVYKDGKVFMQTFYVKTGETEEHEDKVTYDTILSENVQMGDDVEVSTKKRTIKGQVASITYSNVEKTAWLNILTESGKKEWVSLKAMKSFLKAKTESKEEYKVIKSLGGSTGAVLVEDMFGNKYVKKTGKDLSHITREYEALKIYDYMGVPVPKIHKFDKEKGELYTEYIENSTEIGKLPASAEATKELKKDFGVDALLANWDVVGMSYDNVLKDNQTSKYIRIDVGGSLDKRAQGEDKEFGSEVKELESMLDGNVNAQTANIFEGVNVVEQVEKTIEKYKKSESQILTDPTIGADIKTSLMSRVAYLKEYLDKNKPKAGVSTEGHDYNFQGKLYDYNPSQVPIEVSKFYDKLNEDLKLTDDDIKTLKKDYYFTDEYVKSNLDSYLDGHAQIKFREEAKKAGLNDTEIYVIRDYTGSEYGNYNDIAKSVTNSPSGNINFNKEKLVYGDEAAEGTETKTETKTELFSSGEAFDTLLIAAKSLNYAKSKGNKADDMNQTKFNNALTTFNQLTEYVKGMKAGDVEVPYGGKAKVAELFKEYRQFFKNVANDKEHPMIDPGKGVGLPVLKKETKTEVTVKKGLPAGTYKYNGFGGKNKLQVAKLKVLVNAIAKMESGMKNTEFWKESVFSRGIYTKSKDYSDQFRAQYNNMNDIVMTQWGSSSTFEGTGFSADTKIKIVGGGIHINEISKHKGGESEVLHKPFTLFRNIHYLEEDPSEYNKRLVTVAKIG